mgnify:FL=1
MEQKRLTILFIEWWQQTTGFGILRVEPSGSPLWTQPFKIIGQFTNPAIFQEIDVEGHHEDHELFGSVFITKTAKIVGNDLENSLVEKNIRPELRRHVLAYPEKSPYQMDLPDTEADKLAEAKGLPHEERIRGIIESTVESSHVKEGDLKEVVARRLGVSIADTNAVLAMLYRSGVLVLTQNGFVVSKEDDEAAEVEALKIPVEPKKNFLDDTRWRKIMESEAIADDSLVPSELNAVRVAIENDMSIIDVKNPARIEPIREVIRSVAETYLGGAEVNATIGDVDRYADDEEKIRAMIDSGIVPMSHVEMEVVSQLDELRYAILKKRKLSFTAVTQHEEEQFAEGHDGDYSLWAVLADEDEVLDVIVNVISETAGRWSQVLTVGPTEYSVALSEAIRSKMTKGASVLDRWRIGDKVITEDGHVEVVDGTPLTGHLRTAWALPLRDAALAGQTWATVVVVVPPDAKADWMASYNALMLAEDRLVVVGSHDGLRSLTGEAKPSRNEALYCRLKNRGSLVGAR